MYHDLMKQTNYVRRFMRGEPKIAIVLGSGLYDLLDYVKVSSTVPFSKIEGFPTATIEGHKGRFVFGKLNNVEVVIQDGRVHYYEGYTMQQVVNPVRILGMLGIKTLLLTNAAGGVSDKVETGDIMLINDFISFFVPSPLIGPNLGELGERFVDVNVTNNEILKHILIDTAYKLTVPLKRGDYVQLTGPQYESISELLFLKKMGVDAVGMSTVVEAIAASHMGMQVCGISCITNKTTKENPQLLNHADVEAVAKGLSRDLGDVLKEAVPKIANHFKY